MNNTIPKIDPHIDVLNVGARARSGFCPLSEAPSAPSEALTALVRLEPEPRVSLRDVHASLESKQEFSHWVKNRVEQCDLVKDQDYGVYDKFIENPHGGRPRKEYWATLDAAKEIALMEGTAKGKQMRRYFIECEKRWRATSAIPDLKDPEVALKLVIQYAGELLESRKRERFNEE